MIDKKPPVSPVWTLRIRARYGFGDLILESCPLALTALGERVL